VRRDERDDSPLGLDRGGRGSGLGFRADDSGVR
jgi:hypothetical protein